MNVAAKATWCLWEYAWVFLFVCLFVCFKENNFKRFCNYYFFYMNFHRSYSPHSFLLTFLTIQALMSKKNPDTSCVCFTLTQAWHYTPGLSKALIGADAKAASNRWQQIWNQAFCPNVGLKHSNTKQNRYQTSWWAGSKALAVTHILVN